MDVEQIELLPCPFCGGSAFMVQEGTHAQCLTPGCCVGPICGLDSWNTRAALTPTEGDMGNPISGPDGFVLVPVEPTREMVECAVYAQEPSAGSPAGGSNNANRLRRKAKRIWAAMLNASGKS